MYIIRLRPYNMHPGFLLKFGRSDILITPNFPDLESLIKLWFNVTQLHILSMFACCSACSANTFVQFVYAEVIIFIWQRWLGLDISWNYNFIII